MAALILTLAFSTSVVGVPEMSPVLELILNPVGNASNASNKTATPPVLLGFATTADEFCKKILGLVYVIAGGSVVMLIFET